MRTLWLGCIAVCVIVFVHAAEEDILKLFPESFPSKEAATAYAHSLPIGGGDVAFVNVRGSDIMVMFAHGSGVPEMGVAAYKRVDAKWQLQTKIYPPSFGEFHKVMASKDEVLLIGEKSKGKWTLLKVK